MKNDNTDELKREKRSLLAKIDRRETAILFARRDIGYFRQRIAIINGMLAERSPAAREARHDG